MKTINGNAAVKVFGFDAGKGAPSLQAEPKTEVYAVGPASPSDMLAELAKLQRENEALRLAATKVKSSDLRMKVSEKGALSIYGLGRFPVTLYVGQWARLFKALPQIQAFIEENASKFSVKGE